MRLVNPMLIVTSVAMVALPAAAETPKKVDKVGVGADSGRALLAAAPSDESDVAASEVATLTVPTPDGLFVYDMDLEIVSLTCDAPSRPPQPTGHTYLNAWNHLLPVPGSEAQGYHYQRYAGTSCDGGSLEEDYKFSAYGDFPAYGAPFTPDGPGGVCYRARAWLGEVDQSSIYAYSEWSPCCCYEIAGPVANDTCADATEIVCPPGGGIISVRGSTERATFTGPFACEPYDHSSPEVWYRVIGNGGPITATTCSDTMPWLDTLLFVFEGPCGAFACLGGSDDTCASGAPFWSTVQWPSVPGTAYTVMVQQGSWTPAGEFELTVECEAPVCNLIPPTITGIGGAACGGSTSDTTPTLTWDDVANDSGYGWEVRRASGTLVRSGTVGRNVTSVNAGSLDPGSYTAHVWAFGQAYCIGPESDCSFTVTVECQTLSTPSITAIGSAGCGGSTPDTTPTLTWGDVAHESG